MPTATVYTGDDVQLIVTLTRNDDPVAIDETSTVLAAIRTGLQTNSTATLLAGPWTLDPDAPGADWATGVVVVDIPGDDTQDLAATRSAALEIQQETTGGARSTWIASRIEIIRDTIH